MSPERKSIEQSFLASLLGFEHWIWTAQEWVDPYRALTDVAKRNLRATSQLLKPKIDEYEGCDVDVSFVDWACFSTAGPRARVEPIDWSCAEPAELVAQNRLSNVFSQRPISKLLLYRDAPPRVYDVGDAWPPVIFFDADDAIRDRLIDDHVGGERVEA